MPRPIAALSTPAISSSVRAVGNSGKRVSCSIKENIQRTHRESRVAFAAIQVRDLPEVNWRFSRDASDHHCDIRSSFVTAHETRQEPSPLSARFSFRVSPHHKRVITFLSKIDTELEATGQDAAWLRTKNLAAPFDGQTLLAYMTRGYGGDGRLPSIPSSCRTAIGA
jgi:hypothetical protein